MSAEVENEILKQLERMHKAQSDIRIAIDENKTKLGEIDNALRGTYETKGALTRIATLEEAESLRKKITFTAVTATIISVVSAAVSLFKGGH